MWNARTPQAFALGVAWKKFTQPSYNVQQSGQLVDMCAHTIMDICEDNNIIRTKINQLDIDFLCI
jgi:hypothetical protein